MGRSKRHRRKEPCPPARRPERAARRDRIRARKRKEGYAKGESWFFQKRPVLRFVFFLVLLMVGFNVCFYLWITGSDLFQSYLHVYATIAAGVLQIFGDSAVASGTSVSTSRFALSIRAGCDAIQPSAFFVFSVLAYPSSVRLSGRLFYALLGTLVLSAVNLLRIVTLFYTGVYFPSAFEVLHIDVWQAVFIFLPLMLWVQWIRRASQMRNISPNVAM